MVHRQGREHHLNAAGSAQQMPRHRLGRTDHEITGCVFAQSNLNGIGFIDVAKRRRSTVGIHVVNVSPSQARMP